MTAREIYLVRHGQTEWNAEGRYQGAFDSPLTALGREQARALGRRLAERRRLPPVDLHVSPQGRARETADIILGEVSCRSTIVEPRLREVSLGSWDGLTDFDIDALAPGALDGANRFDWFFRSPDGESYEATAGRARQWLNDVNGVIVAVSHGLFSRFIRSAYLELDRAATLRLPVEQGVVWRLIGGDVEVISS